jgi:hypothetical protein
MRRSSTVRLPETSIFIDASPAGVISGKNDEQLLKAMLEGYEEYRKIGTQHMHVRHVHITRVDEHHCVAHVSWTATYARDDLPETAIDFDVHYLVQILNAEPKVFGWMAGDEQAVLKQHGVI